jgi:hypothetical protein
MPDQHESSDNQQENPLFHAPPRYFILFGQADPQASTAWPLHVKIRRKAPSKVAIRREKRPFVPKIGVSVQKARFSMRADQ